MNTELKFINLLVFIDSPYIFMKSDLGSTRKSAILSVLLFVLTFVFVLAACGGGESSPAATHDTEPEPVLTPSPEPLVITIGNLTDVTGPSASAQEVINLALDDIINYYNDEDVIPGVEFELLNYDTRLDPSRYTVGYEWLMQNGADFILTGVPGVDAQLRDRVNENKTLLMTLPPSKAGLIPAGYVFCLGTTFNDDIGYTVLKWIAENDPDFPRDRPAKIGGAAWDEPNLQTFFSGAEQYCLDNPGQFDWEGGFLTDLTFDWDEQIESLKDCDYVIPPQLMSQFVLKYRSEGYSAKFVGIEAQMAFLDMVDKSGAWGAIDDMLFFKTSPWWNDESEHIDFIKELLIKNHPEKAESIMKSGSGYLGVLSMNILFNFIEDTVAAGMADRFDSQLIYETAQSFSIDIDGAPHGFTDTKRTSASYVRVYEIDASRKDMFKVDSAWYPISCLP